MHREMRAGLSSTGLVVLLVVTAGAVGCSDDGVAADGGAGSTSSDAASTGNVTTVGLPTDGTGTDPDTGTDAGRTDTTTSLDGTDGPDDDDDDDSSDSTGEIEPGVLPEPVTQSGVAYVAHFLSNDLLWYRTDGDAPAEGGSIDAGGWSHDLALDPVGDRLYIAQDVAGRVQVYALTRPDSADDPVDDPMLIGSLDVDSPPRFVRVDPYHDRIYVVADAMQSGTGMMRLHTVDVSDPTSPSIVDTADLPSTTSLDVDGARRLLVLFHGITDAVHAYDLSTDTPVEVSGSPVDLMTFYPEDNQVAFAARNLALDPWHNRVYAARPQGALSELIVMEYPEVVPGEGQPYDDATEFSLSPIEDPFDLSIDIAKRPGVLDAYTPMPSASDELVFLLADAWNGTQSTATVVTFAGTDPLTLEPGCADHEEFGCFVRSYVDGNPVGFLRTDGAACRDSAHDAIVATAIAMPEDEPGQVAFFQYEGDAATGTWLTADGGNLPASALPIGAVCH